MYTVRVVTVVVRQSKSYAPHYDWVDIMNTYLIIDSGL